MGRMRRELRGLTILEILIAMALLMMVIMATAMVYPSGYKLNETNRYANQATEIARGIVEELMMRPFTSPGGAATGINNISLTTLTNWDPDFSEANHWPYYDGSAPNVWKRQSPVASWYKDTAVQDMKSKLEDDSLAGGKKFFFLPPQDFQANAQKGIIIQSYPDFSLPIDIKQGRMVKIEVTVAWIEARMRAQGATSTLITKWVTLNAWRTENKFDF
jgi:Tfp pilus assembly protein PilV